MMMSQVVTGHRFIMQTLKIVLQPVNDQSINVDISGPGLGETSHVAPLPFTPTELPVVLRALEINRSVSETFNRDEWMQLEEWGIVSGQFQAGADGEMRLTETDINIDSLLSLVQTRLYAVLFEAHEANIILRIALKDVPAREALHIQLQFPPGDPRQSQELLLGQYPWEVLSYAHTAPLWQDKRVAFSRYIRTSQPVPEPQSVERLRVLVVTARPVDLPVGVGQDAAGIVTGLRRRLSQFPVRIRELPQATFEALSNYLSEQASQHVIHFDGHGDFGRRCANGHLSVSASALTCSQCGTELPGPDSFSGYLAFELTEGTVVWVSADEFAELLLDHGLQLVVLNACNSGLARRGEDVFNGVAQSLIRRGIPAVVATPFRLDWEAAVEFARYFYQHIGQNEPPVTALDQSRRRLRARRDTPREWYRPVLYLRQAEDKVGQLFRMQSSAPMPEPEESQESRSLHIYTFQDLPPKPPEKALYWQRYFDKNRQLRRATPGPSTWTRELIPDLRERKQEIGPPGTIYLRTKVPLCVGLAVGHVFPQVGGYRLEVFQNPPELWSSDVTPPPGTDIKVGWDSRVVPGDESQKEAVLIVFAVNSRGRENAIQPIGEYLGESEVFNQLIAEDSPQRPSNRFRQIMLLSAEPVVTEQRFLLEWETAYLAQASEIYLADIADGVETVHLFLVAPVSMAAFLGYHWNAVNVYLQHHEWIGGETLYAPSCRLPLA